MKQNVASSEGMLNAMPSFMKRSRWRGFQEACQLQPFAPGKCYKHCWNVEPLTTHLQQTYPCMHHFGKKYEPTWIHEACIMQHMMPLTAVEILFLSCTKFCFAPQTQAMRLDHQGCLLIPLRRGMEEDQFSHCTLDKSEVLSATSHHYTLLNSKKPPSHQIL